MYASLTMCWFTKLYINENLTNTEAYMLNKYIYIV